MQNHVDYFSEDACLEAAYYSNCYFATVPAAVVVVAAAAATAKILLTTAVSIPFFTNQSVNCL